MSDTIPTKAAAEACETTPRTLRIFLRASKDYEAAGSGGRYAFTEDDLPELKTRFDAWQAEREAAAKAKEKAATAKSDEAPATPAEEKADDKPAEDKPAPRTRARKTTAA